MLIGPPGSFKTTMIEAALEDDASALPLSNLNAKEWGKIRNSFVTGRLHTIALGELETVYMRNQNTAMMTESIFQRLVAEGDRGGPGKDPRMQRSVVRALVVGGITEDCYERRYDAWEKSGFSRRFLWMLFHVSDPEAVLRAIREWKKIDFGAIYLKPANRNIEMSLTEPESKQLEKILKVQPGLHGTGYVLMKKIVAVLKWKYKRTPERVQEILNDVAPCFTKHGAELIL